MRAGPDTILRLIAIGIGGIAALMAAMELAGSVAPSGDTAPAIVEPDPLRAELERCRAITPDALDTDVACQTAWAENRRRFFTPASEAGNGRDAEE